MKITANLLLAAAIFCLAACSDTKTNQDSDTARLEDISGGASAANPDFTPVISPDGTTPVQDPANNAAGATLNPPHGQPGHDCAIPVGQPLNSSASASASNPKLPANTDISVTTNEPQANEPVAAGMNPPHGQPGHDCAIPVGAPLKK